MKRISKCLLFIFILILGVINVYAEDLNINDSNKLSSIKLDGRDLEFFNEDVNDYEIILESDIEKINISATKKSDQAVISGDIGEEVLSYGINKFSIKVVNQSGLENIYHLDITREDLRSSINTLKTLSLSTGEINFKPNIFEYNINVANDIDKITIKSSLTDTKSRYVEDYQNREIELIEGSNKIEIKIISEKGDIKIYTLNINRALSGNNSLKSLKVNDEKIKLIENEFIYNISFEHDIDRINIEALAKDSKALVKMEEVYELQVGNNEIIIKVVAANGKEASYILNVTRNKLLSKDSLLTNIKVKGYDIGFKEEIRVYNLKIKDEDTLEIETTKEDDSATVEIEGNKDLINGSIIKINVKAEDGTFTRYFINIEKGKKSTSPVIIILIVLFILLVGCIGTIIYRKKRKKKINPNKIVSFELPRTDEVIPENNNYINHHELEESQKKDI